MQILFIDDGSNQVERDIGIRRKSINELEQKIRLLKVGYVTFLEEVNISEEKEGNRTIFKGEKFDNFDYVFMHNSYNKNDEDRNYPVNIIAKLEEQHKTKIFSFSGGTSEDDIKNKIFTRNSIYKNFPLLIKYYQLTNEVNIVIIAKGWLIFEAFGLQLVDNITKLYENNYRSWRQNGWEEFENDTDLKLLFQICEYEETDVTDTINRLKQSNPVNFKRILEEVIFEISEIYGYE